MKYSSLFTILAFLVVSAGSAFAQNSDNADITASATIATALGVTSGDDLDFGSILTNVNVILDPHSDGTNSNTGAAATVGEFFISGSADSEVGISLNNNTITLENGTNSFDFNPWVVGNNTNNNENAANTTEIIKDGSAETTVVTLGDEDGGNNYFIWVGGEISETENSDLDEGVYSATITLTAEYQ